MPTKTYAQIVKQIRNLEQEAERLRRQEIDGVIARIREAISVYNLSPQDLGFSNGTGAVKRAGGGAQRAPDKRQVFAGKKTGSKPQRAVKFADGKGGTWGGRGKRPQWLRDALAGGKQLSDFAV